MELRYYFHNENKDPSMLSYIELTVTFCTIIHQNHIEFCVTIVIHVPIIAQNTSENSREKIRLFNIQAKQV